MKTTCRRSELYKGHRFLPEIISQCVWLYFRFCLSFRDVSEMMLARSVEVSHEAVRYWTIKFGSEYARRLRYARSPRIASALEQLAEESLRSALAATFLHKDVQHFAALINCSPQPGSAGRSLRYAFAVNKHLIVDSLS
jgi:transposase-like protein